MDGINPLQQRTRASQLAARQLGVAADFVRVLIERRRRRLSRDSGFRPR